MQDGKLHKDTALYLSFSSKYRDSVFLCMETGAAETVFWCITAGFRLPVFLCMVRCGSSGGGETRFSVQTAIWEVAVEVVFWCRWRFIPISNSDSGSFSDSVSIPFSDSSPMFQFRLRLRPRFVLFFQLVFGSRPAKLRQGVFFSPLPAPLQICLPPSAAVRPA